MNSEASPESTVIPAKRAARTVSLACRFTPEEAKQLDAAAKAAGKPTREWTRAALLAAAGGHSADDPALIEIVGVRMLCPASSTSKAAVA